MYLFIYFAYFGYSGKSKFCVYYYLFLHLSREQIILTTQPDVSFVLAEKNDPLWETMLRPIRMNINMLYT